MTTQQIPSSLGAQQFPEYLGIPPWQFERALRLGHIPAPDRARRRWSRTVVQQVRDQLAGITAATGAMPDMGATRAAAYLTERFDTEVTADAVAELGRQGALRTADTYKDHPLYNGLDLEQFEDQAAAQEAGRLGRQITRTEAAELLGVRETDIKHLHRAGYLTPTRYAHSRWQRRREDPAVPLYRLGDLHALQDRDDIDWAVVRAVAGPGRRSPFAALPSAHT
ncbi:hypothetical protein ABZ569_31030 [Streptomyces albus]|uniref:hypothetical protein n=1 Tax=Streptomyces albus TaxID=1888 RepID=UPI00340F8EBE